MKASSLCFPLGEGTGFFCFSSTARSEPAIPIPRPQIGESENEFIIRAHRALVDEFPDTDQRNAIVFQAWREAHGPTELEKQAHSKFGDDQFSHARDVPVFAEHEYIDRKGRPQKYDLDALKAVCDRCNYRIADTGNFAALSDGHTPTRDQADAGARMPPILGFSGPFRLGMIGNKEPRWAIFSDEHYYRDEADRIRRLPTRSPEVWLKESMADRFMDPIAMLGAETPRLDMGMRFALTESGQQVEKYSAALAGGNNGFVPAMTDSKRPGIHGTDLSAGKERYEEDEPGDSSSDPSSLKNSSKEGNLMLAPEDIKQIVDAVMQTDVMQWTKAKMLAEADAARNTQADQANGDDDSAVGDQVDQNAMNESDDRSNSVPDGVPPAESASAADGTSRSSPDEASAGDEPPEKKDRFSMSNTERARYARVEAENRALNDRVTKLERENMQIRERERNTERRSKLNDLRRTYALDIDKEFARCKSMTNEQFTDHLACITENYSRIPLEAGLYVPDTIEIADAERYSRECAQEAMQMVETEREKGNHGVSYDSCLASVKARRSSG